MVLVMAASLNMQAQNSACGLMFNDTFDQAGALPGEWTEYNTSGRITVENGYMKFNHNTSKPSAFRTFTPVTNNFSFSFDVQSSRNSVNGQIHLVSSTGKYLASFVVGKNSTATIKYATNMTAGVPEGYTDGSPLVSLLTNTFYSLSAYVDFTNKNVDFYCNGNLMAGDVPFLEPATDFAKVDIQILYMYSNSGTFFFDNISVVKADEQRLLLTNEVTTAQKTYSEAIVGDGFQQYPQAAATAFKQVIDASAVVNANCAATTEQLTTSLTNLQAAEVLFFESRNNPVVLKLYSAYNFKGEEADYKCGYYNGTLSDFDDKTVSFKLDKGYMVTFAQDVNGLGISKVYVAQGKDLAINLPAALQRTVSFIRVSPWYDTEKKGGCGKGADVMDALGVHWSYAWGLDNGYSTSTREFVPMSWSGGNSLDAIIKVGKDMTFNHLLAFNEPDLPEQSNMTVAKALEAYPKQFASGLRLGSPAVSHGGLAWINEFMDSCVARGYRVDFIAIHDYVRRTPAGYYNRFKALADKYHLPIWVTEYNYGNPGIGSPVITDDVALSNLKNINKMLDSASIIERYSMFYFQPGDGQLSIFTTRTPLVLNSIGEYYRDHVSPLSYSQENYEQGPDLYTGTEDVKNNVPGLSIYPNPVNGDYLRIVCSELSSVSYAKVKIYDVNGRIVLSRVLLQDKINVGNLNNGLYFVKVESKNGQLIKKITINK